MELQPLYAPYAPTFVSLEIPEQAVEFESHIPAVRIDVFSGLILVSAMQDKVSIMHLQSRMSGVGGRVGPANHVVPTFGHGFLSVFVGIYWLASFG